MATGVPLSVFPKICFSIRAPEAPMLAPHSDANPIPKLRTWRRIAAILAARDCAMMQTTHSYPSARYRYYDLVMAAFVTVLLCSDVIGVQKVVTVWGFTFGAGILFFPLSYVFGDVLAEVYGYARSRRVIWAGFGALIFASFMSWVIVTLPPKPSWPHQAAYEMVFGQTPR